MDSCDRQLSHICVLSRLYGTGNRKQSASFAKVMEAASLDQSKVQKHLNII